MSRAHLAASVAAACTLTLGTVPVHAQGKGPGGYPLKPIRFIVPFAPGGTTDLIARMIGNEMSDAVGQQWVVDNRGGAGGTIAADIVARAAGDGYTIMLNHQGMAFNKTLYPKLPFDTAKAFTAISLVGVTPNVLVVNNKVPAKSLKELLAHARKNPGKINWGSAGNATSLHVGLALFQSATGTSITHVPYKGTAPALVDVVGGQINAMYTTSISAEVHIKSGRLKVLGVAGPKRQDVLPDVPTLAEQGITGADAIVWFGLVAPVKTPRAVIDVLNREANLALAAADVRKRLDSLGLIVGGGSVKELDDFMKNEVSRLLKLVKLGALTRD
jgi:tripartite-type tricarboxylate transporter receptor subunit TctC